MRILVMALDLLVSEDCIARFPVVFEEETWLSETDTIDDNLSFCKLEMPLDLMVSDNCTL
jgi:hypothetical protein